MTWTKYLEESSLHKGVAEKTNNENSNNISMSKIGSLFVCFVSPVLKELCHDTLSHFCEMQNQLQIEELASK